MARRANHRMNTQADRARGVMPGNNPFQAQQQREEQARTRIQGLARAAAVARESNQNVRVALAQERAAQRRAQQEARRQAEEARRAAVERYREAAEQQQNEVRSRSTLFDSYWWDGFTFDSTMYSVPKKPEKKWTRFTVRCQGTSLAQVKVRTDRVQDHLRPTKPSTPPTKNRVFHAGASYWFQGEELLIPQFEVVEGPTIHLDEIRRPYRRSGQ